jgi:hypothetical protein
MSFFSFNNLSVVYNNLAIFFTSVSITFVVQVIAKTTF